MRRMYIYLSCLCMLLLTGCSVEEDFPAGDSTLVLHIPNATSRAAGNGETNADESLVTADEGRVSDLWFMAYPTDGTGERFVRHLDVKQLDTEKCFNLKLKYGTYRIYVAANLPGVSNDITEEELKTIVLSFKEGDNLVLPSTAATSYGLPMFYAAAETITISEGSSKDINAELVFLCSKLKYTIEFDNTSFSQETFKSNGFKITDITIKNIATSSALFNQESYSDFTLDNQSHTGILTLDNQQKKWNYTGTVYLPEHYITDENKDNLTCLEIKGVEINLNTDGSEGAPTTVEHTYHLPLGGDVYDAATPDPESKFAGGSLVRGHYYDITAKIKGGGKQDLNITMDIFKWTTQTISVDFSQTELWVSRTGEPQKDNMNYEMVTKGFEQILVTSLNNDSISYKTNAPAVTVECIDKIGENPLIHTETTKDGKIRFSVNPEIALSEYTTTQGTARIAIKANNLTKYVDVQYNVTSYFNVSPLSVEIQTNAGEQDTYVVSFETNMGGGIAISPTTLQAEDGNGKVEITCTDMNKAQGKIYLKADGNTQTSWKGEFTVTSKSDKPIVKTVQVTVKPMAGDYIIHFIAINDDCETNGEAKIYKELYNKDSKPTDGWGNHNIYIYTQYGITSNGEIPRSVWYFFDTSNLKPEIYWPGVAMAPDPNNKGWMYYSLPWDYHGTSRIASDSTKTPKPGETLIMFNSGYHDPEILNHRHRYPYDLEPGVSLFDFLDKEGWFVYDPTSNAYEFSAEKPELVLVTYTMYTKGTDPVIDNWYRNYGKQENNDKLSIFGFTSTHTSTSGDFYNLTTPESDVIGWNKTQLQLWAAKGKEGKAIIVKNNKENDDTRYGIMFGGQKFKDNTGYFDNGWHEGKPKPPTD